MECTLICFMRSGWGGETRRSILLSNVINSSLARWKFSGFFSSKFQLTSSNQSANQSRTSGGNFRFVYISICFDKYSLPSVLNLFQLPAIIYCGYCGYCCSFCVIVVVFKVLLWFSWLLWYFRGSSSHGTPTQRIPFVLRKKQCAK